MPGAARRLAPSSPSPAIPPSSSRSTHASSSPPGCYSTSCRSSCVTCGAKRVRRAPPLRLSSFSPYWRRARRGPWPRMQATRPGTRRRSSASARCRSRTRDVSNRSIRWPTWPCSNSTAREGVPTFQVSPSRPSSGWPIASSTRSRHGSTRLFAWTTPK